MNKGNLYIFSAPSGTGKSSLIQELLINTRELLYNKTQLSISHTTRNMRPGEANGKHYYFIKKTEFERMISEGVFLEYAIVFNYYYGTSRKIIENILVSGANVFLEIDWQGAQQIRSKIENTCSIFLLPPSREELYRRLYTRGQDSKEIITNRMMNAIEEISHYHEYDYLVINDNFNQALLDLISIIRGNYLRMKYQQISNCSLINKLLTV